jgi:hypothetical protein
VDAKSVRIDADKIHDVVNTFAELNIPLDFHHANKDRDGLQHTE